MKTNNIVTPSSQVDSTLPLWIRTPDVVMTRGVSTELDGSTLTRNKYRSENHKNFVDFMTKADESEERIGFGQDILQNLLKYRDFDTYKSKIVQYNYLSVGGIESIDDVPVTLGESVMSADPLEIPEQGSDFSKKYILSSEEEDGFDLVDGFGFPEENGVIMIDDEVILYRKRVGNTLYDLERGAAATTILPTFRSRGKYVRTEPTSHYAGAVVVNLSVLFLVSLLDTIHHTYAHNIDSSRVVPEINRSSMLQNIKDFFRSKGTKLGIKALFKILFAENDVQVFYPGDRMVNPSESTWSENIITRVVPIPFVFCDPEENITTPENIIGSEVLFKSYLDDELYARSYCDYSSTYQWEGQTQYEIVLNKDTFEGKVFSNPFTYLTRTLDIAGYGASVDERRDTLTITVESTLGFPERGLVFIDNEAILYQSKTPNQFLDCKRGHIGVNTTHKEGSYVYGPYYVETRIIDKNRKEYVSRSWPLGLVEEVDIKDPGLLHTLQDDILVNDEYGKDMPGRLDPRDAILCSIQNDSVLSKYEDNLKFTFLENYEDNLVNQITTQPERLGFVGDRTYGPDGIYFNDDYVFISSGGFPEHQIGMFNRPTTVPDDKIVGTDIRADHIIFTIPRRDNIKENITEEGKYAVESKGTDVIGTFINGVRAFSNISPEKVVQGRIGHFRIIDKGFGYKNPTIVISPSNSEAEVEVDSSFGYLTDVKSISSGNYIDNPIVRVSSGEDAVLKPHFDNYGRIVRVEVVNGGRFYKDVPIISPVDSTNTGKGGLLSCKILNEQIISVDVVNTGIDYNSLGTSIIVEPIGSGATVEAIVEYYSINRYDQVVSDKYYQFDDGGGFLYEQQPGRTRSLYGYISAPLKLREQMEDDGSEHSPILGWAFDGNPIYGPFGFKNNKDGDDGFDRQRSSYRLRNSRLGIIPGGSSISALQPPSTQEYPMGSFVEDYIYDPAGITGTEPITPGQEGYLATEDPKFMLVDGGVHNDKNIELDYITGDIPPPVEVPNYYLDQFNGKVCNTPEFPLELYPDGVYCYFLTTDDNEVPEYPYIIGDTFRNRPLIQDIEFEYERVERLRNPWITSTRRDLKVEVGSICSGSVDGVIVESGLPNTNMIGDYVYFDNTNTGGGGAQAKVSELTGKEVTSGKGQKVMTNIRSHHQLFDLSYNLDDFGYVKNFTFVEDKDFYTFGDINFSRGVVTRYNTKLMWLYVQTHTKDRALTGDSLYDHTRKLLDIGDISNLPEEINTKRLWCDSLEHFKVGDLVEIDNGALDVEFIQNEIVKITKIFSDDSMEVIRGYEGAPQIIDDGVEMYNYGKSVYVMNTTEPHFMMKGDKVFVSGSEFSEVNGEHTLIDTTETTFTFYTSKIYDEEMSLTYTTNSKISQGIVSNIEITSPGVGYEYLPKVLGTGKSFVDRAETKIYLNGGTIERVEVLGGGMRYTNPKAVFFDFTNNGYGAAADVSVVGGQVASIDITDPGQNYIEPVIYLIESDGKYIATTSDIGKIKSLKVVNPGRNISTDLSLKPELQVTTRCVVSYMDDSVGQFVEGDQVYQGTNSLMTAIGNVIEYDEDRQILIMDDIVGFLQEEPIYNITGTKAHIVVEGQADCRIVVNGSSKPQGKFIDDKSKISESYPVLQDSYRYQWFSYVISSPLQQVEYDNFIQKIIHPAGFVQFADLSISSSVESGSIIDPDYINVYTYDTCDPFPLLVSQYNDTPILVTHDGQEDILIVNLISCGSGESTPGKIKTESNLFIITESGNNLVKDFMR